jgi:hypothetical protein
MATQNSVTPEPGAPPKTASVENLAELRFLAALEGMDKEALGWADVKGVASKLDPRKLLQTAGGGSIFKSPAQNMAAHAARMAAPGASAVAASAIPKKGLGTMIQEGNRHEPSP